MPMRQPVRLVAIMLAVLVLAGCGLRQSPNPLPVGPAAYAVFPNTENWPDEDVIRVGDRLSVRVLGEPELTSDAYVVDSRGNIQVPLAGEVIAAGRHPGELRDDLTRRLGARYIRDPQVAVIVTDRKRTNYTVEGDVREPGVFEALPNTTLLSAIAQAKSPTDSAKLDEVMIFRVVSGQRLGARFNLDDIRKGRAPDPAVLAGDTIVVGRSALKDAWRQFLQAAPVFNLFYIFR
ncbi:MAG: polysaccharide biosynthesis/export family protein [Novosphingobium sp.]|uniref:polysaccharide biosynthesis/export family protein n=1 Tax=Novosphingobium sp. TaxID=1874826 RepID=UPI0032BCE77F